MDMIDAKAMDNFFKSSIEIEASLKSEIEKLKAENEKLKKIKNLSEEIIYGSYPDDDDCRYDHNRNCQEHSCFGLDGDECPVSEFKTLIQTLKQLEGEK